jgi:hypothetical protein
MGREYGFSGADSIWEYTDQGILMRADYAAFAVAAFFRVAFFGFRTLIAIL